MSAPCGYEHRGDCTIDCSERAARDNLRSAGAWPTPVPSEVAETTAGEREFEALARVVRDAVRVRPLGPNSRSVHEAGGSVALTSTEASEAARAVLASDWLAALLDRVRREEGERIAQAIEAQREHDGAGWPNRAYEVKEDAARIARAASVGREEGL